jgi:ribosomal protein L29
MPVYKELNIETLKYLLVTHNKHLLQLQAERGVKPRRIVQVQKTIAKLKTAIETDKQAAWL